MLNIAQNFAGDSSHNRPYRYIPLYSEGFIILYLEHCVVFPFYLAYYACGHMYTVLCSYGKLNDVYHSDV